jgi:methylphosphotriester-DNA--protein-cysteine methyltransferase
MHKFQTDSSRWAALEAHDPEADGNFVYAVRTTGIFCRPVCGARQARRDNITFYDDAEAAQEAGFRACKRCKPDLTVYDPQASKIAQAQQTIEKAAAETGTVPSLDVLAGQVGLTRSHFHRVFKRITGVTPKVYAEGLKKDGRVGGRSPLLMEMGGIPSLGYMTSESSAGPNTPVPSQFLGGMSDASASGQSSGNPNSSLGSQSESASLWENELIEEIYQAASGTPFEKNTQKVMDKDVSYTIQPWLESFVLIALSPEGVCSLDISESTSELVEALRARFPMAKLSLSPWSPSIPLQAGEISNPSFKIFSAIMEALVNPTGKILEIPFDLH